MATITFPGMTLTGDHASRPAATDVGSGTLYACSTHSLVYQSDGSSWATWFTGGSTTSYASNVNAVGEANAGGAASTLTRGDHVHLGVRSIAHASNTFSGPVILTATSPIGITSPTPGTLNISSAAVAGGSALTVQDEGTPLATAASTLNFVGSGVTASGTGATKTITIAGGGGGSASYLGKNAVGGTQFSPTLNQVIAKSVTPGADGTVLSIDVYNRENTDSLHTIVVAIYANNGGSLGKLLAMNVAPQYGPTNNSSFADNDTVSVPGWSSIPLVLRLSSGTTYWIAVQFQGGSGRMYYDGSGSDRRYTAGGAFLVDGGRYSEGTDSRDHSIRALFIS